MKKQDLYIRKYVCGLWIHRYHKCSLKSDFETYLGNGMRNDIICRSMFFPFFGEKKKRAVLMVFVGGINHDRIEPKLNQENS